MAGRQLDIPGLISVFRHRSKLDASSNQLRFERNERRVRELSSRLLSYCPHFSKL